MIYDLLHIKRPTKGSKSCSYGADTNQSVGNSDINISDCNEKPAYLYPSNFGSLIHLVLILAVQ